MGAVTARAAGVADVVVATPPPVDPVTLAACELVGVSEVHRIGGAQAIAALAYGTEIGRRRRRDRRPGQSLRPGGQAAAVGDRVGIDGFAGPSDLVVLFDADDAGSIRLIALDLLAQAEHGEASLVVAVARGAALLDALEADLRGLWSEPARAVRARRGRLARPRPRVRQRVRPRAPGADRPGRRGARAAGAARRLRVRRLAGRRRRSATTSPAPTTSCRPAGSARFASALGPRHFRRQMAEVRIAAHGARGAGARPVCRSPAPRASHAHAESMRARVPDFVENPAS